MTRTSTKRSYSYHPERLVDFRLFGILHHLHYTVTVASRKYAHPRKYTHPLFAASYCKGLLITRKYAHPTNQNNM